MHKIHFSSNWNGKLLNDCFTTIRRYNYDKYPDFQQFEVEYKNQIAGIAELDAKKPFKFSALNDITSMVDTGKDVGYLHTLLLKFYPELTPDSNLYLLVFRWKVKNADVFEMMFKERWEKIQEAQPTDNSIIQPSLFE